MKEILLSLALIAFATAAVAAEQPKKADAPKPAASAPAEPAKKDQKKDAKPVPKKAEAQK